MTEVDQEFHAERMDRAEEGAVKRSLYFLSQNFRGGLRTRDRQDAFGDRSGFAGTRRCDYRKIAVQLGGKTSAYIFVARLHHISHSSFSRTSAGCVSAHLSSKMSLSIDNVASGYGAL